MTPTDALRAARVCILTDRTRTLHTCAESNGDIGPHLHAALAEYDAVLAQIDEALREDAMQRLADIGQEMGGYDVPNPVAWMFQHEDAGRVFVLPQDGLNPPDRFIKMNPRYSLIGPLYSAPPLPRYEPQCPRPGNNRPDTFTMAECILAGECGCTVAGHEYAQKRRSK